MRITSLLAASAAALMLARSGDMAGQLAACHRPAGPKLREDDGPLTSAAASRAERRRAEKLARKRQRKGRK